MNLTDLQVELRAIEEHIATLHSEIEKMKPQTEEEKRADFEQITSLAEKHLIVNKSILGAPMEIKKLIFSSMSYILLLDEKDFYNRMLYLCRLSKGCGFTASAEDLYKIGLQFEMTDLHKLSNDIADYKYPYLVESLIIANLSEEASVSILSLIADLAKSFDISKEQVRVLGMMAKAILTNDIDYMLHIPIPSKNMWNGKLRDYISEEWIVNHRMQCGVLCTKKYNKKMESNQENTNLFLLASMNATGQSKVDYAEEMPCVIKSRLQTGEIVKKGDVICTYLEKKRKKRDKKSDSAAMVSFFRIMEEQSPQYVTTEKKIIAPCDGIVYFIENQKRGAVKDQLDEYIGVYVVSYFDDYTDFSKWCKSK